MDAFTARVQRSVDETPGFRNSVIRAKLSGDALPSLDVSLAIFGDDPIRLYGCLAFARDEGVRESPNLERMLQLPTPFRPAGNGVVTAGNASQISDGAAALLLGDREVLIPRLRKGGDAGGVKYRLPVPQDHHIEVPRDRGIPVRGLHRGNRSGQEVVVEARLLH